MTHITCRLTAKNRDQFRNPTLGNRVWATFTFFLLAEVMRGECCGVQKVLEIDTAVNSQHSPYTHARTYCSSEGWSERVSTEPINDARLAYARITDKHYLEDEFRSRQRLQTTNAAVQLINVSAYWPLSALRHKNRRRRWRELSLQKKLYGLGSVMLLGPSG